MMQVHGPLRFGEGHLTPEKYPNASAEDGAARLNFTSTSSVRACSPEQVLALQLPGRLGLEMYKYVYPIGVVTSCSTNLATTEWDYWPVKGGQHCFLRFKAFGRHMCAHAHRLPLLHCAELR